jgi:hypothetical protein
LILTLSSIMNAPFWKYRDTVCVNRLKAVFEASLKLEREDCIMSLATATSRFCECGFDSNCPR